MKSTTTTNLARVLIAVGVAALLVLGSSIPASAEPRDKPTNVSMGGSGPWTPNDGGEQVVAGSATVRDWHNGDFLPATFTATLTLDADGALPEPGSCRPASLTVVVDGDRFAEMTMVGAGSVCARVIPIAPWIVFQEFNGAYRMTEAGRRNLVGNDGSFRLYLQFGQFGSGSVHATSIVPDA